MFWIDNLTVNYLLYILTGRLLRYMTYKCISILDPTTKYTRTFFKTIGMYCLIQNSILVVIHFYSVAELLLNISVIKADLNLQRHSCGSSSRLVRLLLNKLGRSQTIDFDGADPLNMFIMLVWIPLTWNLFFLEQIQ